MDVREALKTRVTPNIHSPNYIIGDEVKILMRGLVIDAIQNFYDDPYGTAYDARDMSSSCVQIRNYLRALAKAAEQVGLNFRDIVYFECTGYEVYRVNEIIEDRKPLEVAEWAQLQKL